jgi:hypothetical protein
MTCTSDGVDSDSDGDEYEEQTKKKKPQVPGMI